MTKRKLSALYRSIEQLQADKSWGTLLDAGTGVNSIRWISELNTERWCAVTGSNALVQLVHKTIGEKLRSQDQIRLGNWANTAFMQGETFDTVIADYLLGAIEGFSPYFQTFLFRRLYAITRRTLYVTGLEPYVPTDKPRSNAGRILWEIGRFRDACQLLKGGMPYREYPLPWVLDQLQLAGFTVTHTAYYNIRYKQLFVNAQITMALSGLDKMPDQVLARTLNDRAEALRTEALDIINEEGALDTSRNYVIAAEPKDTAS